MSGDDLSPFRRSAVERASRSVVALLVPGSSWASAVHVGGGVFLTARHAVLPRGGEQGPPPPATAAASTRHSSPPRPPPPRVLLQLRSPGGGSSPSSYSWEPAEVDLRPLPPLARGLDVAVVRLLSAAGQQKSRSRRSSSSSSLPLLPLPPAAELAPSVPAAAAPVAVLGFPRVHPRASLGPLATFGVV